MMHAPRHQQFAPVGDFQAAEAPEDEVAQLRIIGKVAEQADHRAGDRIDRDPGQQHGGNIGFLIHHRQPMHHEDADQTAAERHQRQQPGAGGRGVEGSAQGAEQPAAQHDGQHRAQCGTG